MAPRRPGSDINSRPQGISFQVDEKARTRALLIHVSVRGTKMRGDASGAQRSAASRLEEITGLAQAIDLEIADRAVVSIARIVPSTFLGSGKVDEITAQIRSCEADLVVFDGQLSPGQQRNLERAWSAKVLDRTGLILEIFGRRAQTREGMLQVELAHLEYQRSRLVRSWTHLERQRGGFGFLGGPGETQIEADRRVIRDRITAIKKQIAAIKRTRSLHRDARSRVPYPIVAFVGYTNSGKSTLFNRLTGAEVFAMDLLFATLDPTMRQITLPHGRKVILSDTVGFISELPTMLIAAFRATLEEVLEADIIVHVRDISHSESQEQAEDVRQVLAELGLDENRRSGMIELWNKSDLTSPQEREVLEEICHRNSNCVIGSALSGEGMEQLVEHIEEMLSLSAPVCQIELTPADGADLAWLYENSEVLAREDLEDGSIRIVARFQNAVIDRAKRRLAGRLKLPMNDQTDSEPPYLAAQ